MRAHQCINSKHEGVAEAKEHYGRAKCPAKDPSCADREPLFRQSFRDRILLDHHSKPSLYYTRTYRIRARSVPAALAIASSIFLTQVDKQNFSPQHTISPYTQDFRVNECFLKIRTHFRRGFLRHRLFSNVNCRDFGKKYLDIRFRQPHVRFWCCHVFQKHSLLSLMSKLDSGVWSLGVLVWDPL